MTAFKEGYRHRFTLEAIKTVTRRVSVKVPIRVTTGFIGV